MFQAGPVHYVDLATTPITHVRAAHAQRIGATDDDFWNQRADTLYATLVEVDAITSLAARPVDVPKRDRRGWVTFIRARTEEHLL